MEKRGAKRPSGPVGPEANFGRSSTLKTQRSAARQKEARQAQKYLKTTHSALSCSGEAWRELVAEL